MDWGFWPLANPALIAATTVSPAPTGSVFSPMRIPGISWTSSASATRMPRSPRVRKTALPVRGGDLAGDLAAFFDGEVFAGVVQEVGGFFHIELEDSSLVEVRMMAGVVVSGWRLMTSLICSITGGC